MSAIEPQRTRLFGGTLAWLALLGAGCTRNADLEVTLVLPPAPTHAAMFAFVQFDRPPPGERTIDWVNTGDFDGVQLGTEATTARYSLLTEHVDGDVLVRVSFCEMARCGDDGTPPSLLYVLEQPFHFAHRTTWQRTIDHVPDAASSTPETIDRCEIGGCIDPYRPNVWYCRDDGSHFCDPPGSVPVDASVLDAARARDAALPRDTSVDAPRADAARDAQEEP